jgi:hypothetical protein
MQRILPELLKTRQTIQVDYAYGKLNTSKEKTIPLLTSSVQEKIWKIMKLYCISRYFSDDFRPAM